MAIYYPPPQPVQARVYAPIPAQGDQPPRLKRAQQESPSLWEPIEWRSQRRVAFTEGTAAAPGDAPPIYSRRQLNSILSAWSDPPAWPIVLFDGDSIEDRPPVRSIAWSIWEAWRPVAEVIRPRPKLIQAQTGDQPPRFSIVTDVSIRDICEPQPWRTQTLKGTAAWNVPVVEAGDDPPIRRATIERILDAWTRTGWPAQFADQSAAWNASVDNPPPFRRQALERIASEWQQGWYAQTAEPNAGWNVAVVDEPMPRVTQWQIWAAWEVEPYRVQFGSAYPQVTIIDVRVSYDAIGWDDTYFDAR